MTTYTVQLERKLVQRTIVKIEADSLAEAVDIAEELEDPDDICWKTLENETYVVNSGYAERGDDD